MRFFRHSADRLPIGLFTLYFCLDVAVFLLAPSWWMVAVWSLVGLLPKACICAWNHHQQHVATFEQPALNGLLEVMYALQTGALPSAWVLHHNVGHHTHYLDQTLDESRWARLDGTQMGSQEYALQVTATAYPRIWKISARFPRHRRRFVAWGLVVAAVVAVSLWWSWPRALVLFVGPMVAGLYITAWHTYYHHAGLRTDDHFGASWNIVHKAYNVLTGNLGYHTAHHYRCNVHWSELPALHAELADRIPGTLYRRPCIPFRWMGRAWQPEGPTRASS